MGAAAQLPEAPFITSPTAGQALQGVITVQGSTMVEGFQAAELLFGYHGDETQTWFLIAEWSQPISGTLTEWDTATLTDGDYTLRLLVRRLSADPVYTDVPALRVRNYSPVETSTPAPSATPTVTPTLDPNSLPSAPPTPTPSPSPQPSITPTLTPLPPNPAELPPGAVAASVVRGALLSAASLTLLGGYMAIRRTLRR